jgi:diazepam-binding inhibitor (GABA receptor modulator, acyl-CoA-binding protein)
LFDWQAHHDSLLDQAGILSLTSSQKPLLTLSACQPKETHPMSLQKKFDAAVAASKSLAERPDNETLLQLYGLYKQATDGDNETKKPGMMDMVGRAKWGAWDALKGTDTKDAMQQYIDLIESLQ